MKPTIERRGTPAVETPYRMETNENGTPLVRGYAAVFDSESHDLGGFREIIEPNAFDRVLESGPDVVALFNHDADNLLARTTSGTLELGVDERGLTYSFTPPETTLGRDLKILLERGDVSGSSFAFVIADGGQRFVEDDAGTITRYISEISQLVDVSLVTTPAYPETSVALRALGQWRDSTGPVDISPIFTWHLTVARSIAARERIRHGT